MLHCVCPDITWLAFVLAIACPHPTIAGSFVSRSGQEVSVAPPTYAVLLATASYGYLTPRAASPGAGRWLVTQGNESLFRASRVYHLYDRLGQPVGQPLTSKTLELAEGEMPTTLKTSPRAPDQDTSLLALSGLGWKQPDRAVRSEAPTAADRTLVTTFLTAKGVSVPLPKLSATILTDLDGDGTTERLLHADAGGDDGKGRLRNWYSLVLVVTAAGKVHSLGHRVVRNGAEPEQEHFSIVSVLDVDGDGKREVAVEIGLWEGSKMSLYSWNGTAAHDLLDEEANGAGPVRWPPAMPTPAKKPLPMKGLSASPRNGGKSASPRPMTTAEAMRLTADAFRARDGARLLQLISPNGLRLYDAGTKKVIERSSLASLRKDFARRDGMYTFLLVPYGPDDDPGGGRYIEVFKDAKYYNWREAQPGKFVPVVGKDSLFQKYFYVRFEKVGGAWKLAEVGTYSP